MTSSAKSLILNNQEMDTYYIRIEPLPDSESTKPSREHRYTSICFCDKFLLFQDIVAQKRDLFTGRILHLPEKSILHGHHRQLFPNIPHGRNILLYVHI
jgi:hypothetical protein